MNISSAPIKRSRDVTKYLPASQVLNRYDICEMTLWRWQRDTSLGFPIPLIIRRRRMWDVAELDEFDRRQREIAA